MSAADFHKELVSLGVEIAAENGRLRVSAPSGTLTEEMRAALISHKTELLELLENRQPLDPGASPPTETERRLGEIWKDILGLDEIGRTQDFFELGGHSLLGLRLIAIVKAEFGCRIDLAALFESPTIESFALAVERAVKHTGSGKQVGDGTSVVGDPPRDDDGLGDAVDPGKHGLDVEAADLDHGYDFRKVVRLYPESARPQIFGINSTGAYYHLGKKLGSKWSLTALQLFDPSYPLQRMPESIEEIAAQYVQLIRQFQPKGPYRLLGWCAGGVLTFEVAHQLVAANEEVSFVGLIETFAPLHYERLGWLRSRLAALSFRLQSSRISKFGKVLTGEQSLIEFFTRRQNHKPEGTAAEHEYRLMMEYLLPRTNKYQLKTFPGRVHLLRGSMMPKGLFLDDLNGWGAHAAGGVELTFIEGDHHSIFRPPGVDQMAEKIAAALVEANNAENSDDGAEVVAMSTASLLGKKSSR